MRSEDFRKRFCVISHRAGGPLTFVYTITGRTSYPQVFGRKVGEGGECISGIDIIVWKVFVASCFFVIDPYCAY